MNRITKANAEKLYSENAVLVGLKDGIPEDTAKRLLGEESIAFAHRMEKYPGTLCNAYGAGGYTLKYLTLEGFLTACTYTNVVALGRGEG